MVRTKADPAGVKASGGKAPRKTSLTPSSSRSGGKDTKAKPYSGGNPYHPRETPPWQKPITTFFVSKLPNEIESQSGSQTGSSSSNSAEASPSQEGGTDKIIQARTSL